MSEATARDPLRGFRRGGDGGPASLAFAAAASFANSPKSAVTPDGRAAEAKLIALRDRCAAEATAPRRRGPPPRQPVRSQPAPIDGPDIGFGG